MDPTIEHFHYEFMKKNVLCSNDFTLKLRRKKEEKLNYIPLVYKVYKFLFLKTHYILQNYSKMCGQELLLKTHYILQKYSKMCSQSSDNIFWTCHDQKYMASMQNPVCKTFYVSRSSGYNVFYTGCGNRIDPSTIKKFYFRTLYIVFYTPLLTLE